MCLNGSDTQAIDVVTFDYKVTRVLWVVGGSTGSQMSFVYVHNVSK